MTKTVTFRKQRFEISKKEKEKKIQVGDKKNDNPRND